jgi:phospholipid/cholesterol/gamma-HCH transport system substrate-binding protein
MKRVLTLVAIGCLALSGCSGEFKGVYDLPLPGGADVGDHPYSVTVQFADVLDLVPQAAVKVGDVPVGRVREVRLGGDGWTAETVLEVNGDVVLPANAVARLRQSSLLGEKFVELAPPDGQAQNAAGNGRLANGATITLDRTNRNPEFEEIFGALSLLLNGGGIGQLQTINRELSKVMDGNEAQIRSFLSGVDTLMTDLDAHRSDITEALDGLNRLSATLAHRHEQVSGALTDCGRCPTSAPSSSPCCRRWTTFRRWPPTSSTAAATTWSPTCARWPRSSGSSPRPATTCRSRCRCCRPSRSPTRCCRR